MAPSSRPAAAAAAPAHVPGLAPTARGHALGLAPATPPGRGRFMETVTTLRPGAELVAEALISARTDPYLADYLIDGRAVLPAAIGLEAMAQAASALARQPMRSARGVTLGAPVVIAEGDQAVLRVQARISGDGVETVLQAGSGGRVVEHARAVFVGSGVSSPAAGYLGAPMAPMAPMAPVAAAAAPMGAAGDAAATAGRAPGMTGMEAAPPGLPRRSPITGGASGNGGKRDRQRRRNLDRDRRRGRNCGRRRPIRVRVLPDGALPPGRAGVGNATGLVPRDRPRPRRPAVVRMRSGPGRPAGPRQPGCERRGAAGGPGLRPAPQAASGRM